MIMRKLLFLLCFYSSLIYSQDPRLAQQYYNDGEYEKAATLYQSMYQKNPNNDNFFNRYVDCLMALKQFSECEDIVRKEINRKPKEVQLYVCLLYTSPSPRDRTRSRMPSSA